MKDILTQTAQEYGMTVEQLKSARYNRGAVAAMFEVVRRLRAAGHSNVRIAQATGRSKKTINNIAAGRGRTSWESWGSNKEQRNPTRGRAVYVQGLYWEKLQEFRRLTGKSIPTLVNRAVAEMLASA